MSRLPAWHGLVLVGALLTLFLLGLVNHVRMQRLRERHTADDTTEPEKRQRLRATP